MAHRAISSENDNTTGLRLLLAIALLTGAQGCSDPTSSAPPLPPAPPRSSAAPQSPGPSEAWTKTVYQSPADDEIVSAARDVVNPGRQTLTRIVLVCDPHGRQLRISLQSYALTGAGAGEPLPFAEAAAQVAAGTIAFAGRAPLPLAGSLAFEGTHSVLSGIVPLESRSEQDPFFDPAAVLAGSPGARLAALLPIVLSAQTARGAVEITIPTGVASVAAVVQACAQAAAPTAAAAPATSAAPATAATPAAQPVAATPALHTSFNCAAGHSVAERLVCTTPQLAQEDLALQDYYQRSLAASNEASVGPGQRAFIARRNQCTTVACVAEAYRARHEELAAQGYAPED